MGITYLKNKPWSLWTRDGRFFCAVLYYNANKDPANFASWLIGKSELGISDTGTWDLGYEVCLYRDFLWQMIVKLIIPCKALKSKIS